MHSDASSPMDDVHTENEYRDVTQSALSNKPRASSLQPSSTTANSTVANHSGLANLAREVLSSPPRLTGAILTPLEATDLAVKPTKRILFPSPRQVKDQRALGETSLNPSKPSEDFSSKEGHSDCLDNDSEDKENRPPTPSRELHFDDLFEDSHHVLLPRLSTPSPRTNNNLEPFKSPGNPATPDRQVPITGEFLSSAAKLLLFPTTPSRTISKLQQAAPIGELTPMSLHLSQILAEANNSDSLGDPSFDLSALPLGLSPSSHSQNVFDLSTFDHQDFLNTAMPISSSPSWFGVYEDPVEAGSDLWSDFPIPASPDKGPIAEVVEASEAILDKESLTKESSAVLDETLTEEPSTVLAEGSA